MLECGIEGGDGVLRSLLLQQRLTQAVVRLTVGGVDGDGRATVGLRFGVLAEVDVGGCSVGVQDGRGGLSAMAALYLSTARPCLPALRKALPSPFSFSAAALSASLTTFGPAPAAAAPLCGLLLCVLGLG